MPPIAVPRWDSLNAEPLSEAAIRERFPAEEYRVSLYRYPPLARFGGSMRAAACHVLEGACRYVFEDEAVVKAGEVADLPGGRYSLEVLGDQQLVLVLCWELPFEFNRVQ